MVLIRYILARSFIYVCSASLLLTLLFTLIELCEKMVHAQQVGVGAVLHLAQLNIIPSFFDIMPLASFIATLFLIKELYQQDEWAAIAMLSISQRNILRIFFGAGLTLCCIHAIAREKIALPLMAKAEHFKLVTFKQRIPQTLLNQWFMLDPTTLCSCDVIDTKTNAGTNLLIITMTPEFSPKQTIHAPVFSMDPTKKSISFPHGVSFDTETNLSTPLALTTMQLPSFFSQLDITTEPPLLKNIFKHLIFNGHILPNPIKNQLLAKLFKQINESLLLLICPLLTLCFFFLVMTRKGLFNLLPLLPYPLLLITSTAADAAVIHGAPAIVILVPIVAAGIFVLSYYSR